MVEDTRKICVPERYRSHHVHFISAKFGQGIEELKSCIKEKVLGDVYVDPQRSLVPTLRQANALECAREALNDVVTGIDSGSGEELILIDLALARQSLNTITGDTHDYDILDEIFGRFCIGK